jgi:hypothetical protein
VLCKHFSPSFLQILFRKLFAAMNIALEAHAETHAGLDLKCSVFSSISNKNYKCPRNTARLRSITFHENSAVLNACKLKEIYGLTELF